MGNLVEQQLIMALSHDTSQRSLSRQYLAIERLVADLLGGQQHDLQGAGRGPDILISRTDNTPIAIELKVLGGLSLRKSLSNRVASLLSTAVEMRRSFRSEVMLSAIILFTSSPEGPGDQELTVIANRMAHRLIRSTDGVGYDSVIFGIANNRMQWHYFAAKSVSDVGEIEDGNEVEYFHPKTTEDVIDLLREQKADPQPQLQPVLDSKVEKLRVLLVADEWKSGRGGISTVNRELSIALASAGVDATVMVPHTSEEDVKSASEVNVSLVAPPRVPGLNSREALLLRPVFADREWEPDVIVGHGRLLGPYAVAQQQFFPKARRVHFVHTAAEQLEAAKETRDGESRMASADVRRAVERELSQSASLTVGIGPLLTDIISDEQLNSKSRVQSKTICLMPGLRSTLNVSNARPPVKNRILIMGRADDFKSKGIGIAAEALLSVCDLWPSSKPHPPVLVIRGVPYEAEKRVKKKLKDIFEGRVEFHLRPYSDSEDDLSDDLAQARVLLMPSRHEGFGLSAYEAIASGVPVLISSNSGLAQFLQDSNIDTPQTSIIPVLDTPTRRAVDLWADAIQYVLDKPTSARKQASDLRSAIAGKVSWKQSAAELIAEINSLP